MKPFTDKRRMFWLGGMAVLILGFLAAALLLPSNTPIPGAGGPDVRVPKMENVPPNDAPKMKLDLEKEEK